MPFAKTALYDRLKAFGGHKPEPPVVEAVEEAQEAEPPYPPRTWTEIRPGSLILAPEHDDLSWWPAIMQECGERHRPGCGPSRPECSQKEVLQILEGMMLPDASDLMMAVMFGERAQSFRREMRVDFSAIRTKGQNDRAVVCEAAAQPVLGPSWETYKPAGDGDWWAVRFELQKASALRYSAQLTDAGDEIVVEILAKSNR